MLERLQSLQVRIPSTGEVREYLSRYPELTDLVARAAASARERFREEAQVSLELFRDPEAEDEFLTLCVRMMEYPAGVMGTIEEIGCELDDDLAGMRGWFQVTTDFQHPR
jgi:hypothetical protein